jgi:hypothetical protein
MNFDNDTSIQKAMRHFSSFDLARIITHNRDMADRFRRNMNDVCWNFVEDSLEELTRETPEEAYNRFVKEYAAAEDRNEQNR